MSREYLVRSAYRLLQAQKGNNESLGEKCDK